MRPLGPVALAAWTLFGLGLLGGRVLFLPLLFLPDRLAAPVALVLLVACPVGGLALAADWLAERWERKGRR